MNIQKININQINPAVYNPRVTLQPNDEEYQKLKRSIDTFGYVDPIVWNQRTGNLVGGHQRFLVLIEQGLTEIEVSVVDLSLEKEKALNLALNKISGNWDEEKLADLLRELSENPEIDVTISGFDLAEISEILDKASEIEEDDFDSLGEKEKIENPITQKGDLILLGEHRLLCGDSSIPEDVVRLLDGKKIDLIFSDPPYSVSYQGGNSTSPKWEKIKNDDLPQDVYEEWLRKVFENMFSHVSPGAAFYIWNGHKQFGPMNQMLSNLGMHISAVITWGKESFTLNFTDYKQKTEFCIYGWKENNGAHNWYGPDNESTLWEVKRDPTSGYQHPTQKPVALAHRAIKNSSKRGDIVFDAFLGSGTTLIAAEKLQRICYGMELDQGYCDVIVRRYIQLVGKEKINPDLLEKYGPFEEKRNEK
jgi:DNA modification methylase